MHKLSPLMWSAASVVANRTVFGYKNEVNAISHVHSVICYFCKCKEKDIVYRAL